MQYRGKETRTLILKMSAIEPIFEERVLIIDFEISKTMNGELVQKAFYSRNAATRHVFTFSYNVLNNQVSTEIYL